VSQTRLFFKNLALHGIPFCAAILFGPVGRQPTTRVQHGAPFLRITLDQTLAQAHFLADTRRQIFCQKYAYFFAEFLLFLGIA